MKLYRITKKKYADKPFDPIGARENGGRWNSKGTDAIYLSGSESLCALEVLVHNGRHSEIIELYDLYRIDMPIELIARLEPRDLPQNWRAIPATEATQKLGDDFLHDPNARYAALQVPSVISPRDSNYLVNPKHPAMKAIFTACEKLNFAFDPRIFK